MSERVKMDRSEWWKGNFPLWIVVMLLALLGYLGRRELARNDDFHAKQTLDVAELQVRVSVLEAKFADITASLTRIETFQKQINDFLINQRKP